MRQFRFGVACLFSISTVGLLSSSSLGHLFCGDLRAAQRSFAGIVITAAGGEFEPHGAHHVSCGSRWADFTRRIRYQPTAYSLERSFRSVGVIHVIPEDGIG